MDDSTRGCESDEERLALETEIAGLRQALESALGTLKSVEESWSFRLGRRLTAPARWLRGAWKR